MVGVSAIHGAEGFGLVSSDCDTDRSFRLQIDCRFRLQISDLRC